MEEFQKIFTNRIKLTFIEHATPTKHDMHSFQVFTVLLTIAKTWKQPNCTLTEEWIKKIWYRYTMEYYPAIKGNEINAICSNMDGPRDYHTEKNKSDRKREILCDIPYIQTVKRNDTNKLIYKTEIYPQT